jgi:hypothetical protein
MARTATIATTPTALLTRSSGQAQDAIPASLHPVAGSTTEAHVPQRGADSAAQRGNGHGNRTPAMARGLCPTPPRDKPPPALASAFDTASRPRKRSHTTTFQPSPATSPPTGSLRAPAAPVEQSASHPCSRRVSVQADRALAGSPRFERLLATQQLTATVAIARVASVRVRRCARLL